VYSHRQAGQARVEQQLTSWRQLRWIERAVRAVNGVRTGTHDTKTLVMADAIATQDAGFTDQERLPNVDDPVQVI